jgi:crotonobetainyl-CoA:carnitine CoA-transferase CaiB-like acyl-CoA transferase
MTRSSGRGRPDGSQSGGRAALPSRRNDWRHRLRRVAAQGALLALPRSAPEGTARGRRHADSVAALLTYQAGIYFATGAAPKRIGNRHPTIVPYETFGASDGEFVIAVGNDEQWRRFCTVAGLDHDERFATNRQRVTRYDELKPILTERLRTETRQSWIARLTAAGVPCGSVRDLAEVFTDPQLSAREMIASVDHATLGDLQLLGVPVKLSETPGSVRSAPPALVSTPAVLRCDLA